ncbi:hypothetical protein M2360_002554 [Rhizobium sp. SG_E_25_P2]|nr:hypothetical protein [Rhizobium sp. SG_E_25_P2]
MVDLAANDIPMSGLGRPNAAVQENATVPDDRQTDAYSREILTGPHLT